MKKVFLVSAILALFLCFSAFACNSTPSDPNAQAQTAKGDEALKNIKLGGTILAKALDRAIPLEKTLADAGEIDASFEPDLRKGLIEAKADVDTFNTHAAGWTHLDASNKAEISDFAKKAVNFIDDLNNQGLLHIKNPKSRATAALVLEGARTGIDLFDAMNTAAPAPAPTEGAAQ